MKKYLGGWGISLLYSILNGVCGMSIVLIFCEGILGQSNAYQKMIGKLVLMFTIAGAIATGILGYKILVAKRKPFNQIFYWVVNIIILIIPYLWLIFLL